MQGTDIRRWQPDRALFLLVIALVVIGLAMVFSSSTAITLDKGLSPFHFLIKQFIAALIGFVFLYLVLKFVANYVFTDIDKDVSGFLKGFPPEGGLLLSHQLISLGI